MRNNVELLEFFLGLSATLALRHLLCYLSRFCSGIQVGRKFVSLYRLFFCQALCGLGSRWGGCKMLFVFGWKFGRFLLRWHIRPLYIPIILFVYGVNYNTIRGSFLKFRMIFYFIWQIHARLKKLTVTMYMYIYYYYPRTRSLWLKTVMLRNSAFRKVRSIFWFLIDLLFEHYNCFVTHI